MSAQASGVVHFYNGRGTAEQWIKEGKYALHWTRLSCQRFVPNQVRLALFVLAYNLGNFLRRLVLPRKIKHWSLRSLLTKLIKIGAKVIRHSRIVTFQMAEVAISKDIWDNHAVETLCRDCSYQPPRDAETCPACGSARIVRHKELHGLTLAHLDCDAFYAAIEKRDRPELRDVPVVVGGHHRGVVAACCYIARAQGVYSAMPMFKALKACPEATVIKPDMKKYAAVGREVRAMMRNLTPLVEPLSIDEAFMDLAGTEALHRGSPATTLATLARRVEEELSITVSIGLSYNKFLAKIASDLDKPRGFAVIGRAEAKTFLSDKPVSLLWGAGKAMRQRLDKDSITRIGDLVRIDEAELVARYGKIGRRLSLCARGEDDRRVDPEGKARSLSSETTLDKDTAELARLRPILWQLAETVARRMKKAGIAGKGVTLKLKTSTFRIVTRSRRLKSATQSAEELFQTAEPLLVHEADGRAFRLIGIGAHDLVEAGQVAQGDLFGGIGSTESKVEKALDAVREKFGDDAIVKGRGFGTKLERQGPSKVE